MSNERDDQRIDVLAHARASLYVVRTPDGRPRVCGNTTAEERAALRAAIDDELVALQARGFAFDPQNVVRVFDVLCIVTGNDGTQVIIDPLSLLVPILATVDDPLARRH
jgi:hypothetical protein